MWRIVQGSDETVQRLFGNTVVVQRGGWIGRGLRDQSKCALGPQVSTHRGDGGRLPDSIWRGSDRGSVPLYRKMILGIPLGGKNPGCLRDQQEPEESQGNPRRCLAKGRRGSGWAF